MNTAWSTWLGAGLQLALVVGTALWWARLMAHLEGPAGGLDQARFDLLLNMRWMRVGLVTAYSMLRGWMMLRNLRLG